MPTLLTNGGPRPRDYPIPGINSFGRMHTCHMHTFLPQSLSSQELSLTPSVMFLIYIFSLLPCAPRGSFLQESVKQNAIDHRARWQADRDHADRVRRREREEDAKVRAETKRVDHDAFIARQAAVRLREKEQREQDRLDRKMEYEETWRLEESRRAHELKVLAAQIELARCRSK